MEVLLDLLLGLLTILAAARALGEAASRLRMPAIIGELAAGLGLGAAVLAWPEKMSFLSEVRDDEVFEAIVEMGIFFLMFTAGLEVRLSNLLRNSRRGVPIALGGVIVPLAVGAALGVIFIPYSDFWVTQAFFLGVALSITAIPISIRALMDIGALDSRPGSIIVDAAVVDDIIGIVLLAILISMMTNGGTPSGADIGLLAIKVIAFFVIAGGLRFTLLPVVDRLLPKTRAPEMRFTIMLVFGAALAATSEWLDMHFMIGAFVAGVLVRDRMVLSKESVRRVEQQLGGVTTGLLAPIFFASRGLHLNLAAFQVALPFTLTLIAVAIVSKLIGCAIPARLMNVSSRDSLAIGVGMSGRGGVELIIASVALKVGLFDNPVPVPPVVSAMFSAVVIMAIVSSLIAPLGLRLLLGSKEPLSVGSQEEPR